MVAARPQRPGAWSVRLVDSAAGDERPVAVAPLLGATPPDLAPAAAPDEHLLEATRTADGLLDPRRRAGARGRRAGPVRPPRPAGAGGRRDGHPAPTGAAGRSGQRRRRRGTAGPDGAVVAPTVGVVVAVHVHPGETVAAGQPLVALEAMKIEQSLVAPRAGTVRRVACSVGDSVAGGTLLVELE